MSDVPITKFAFRATRKTKKDHHIYDALWNTGRKQKHQKPRGKNRISHKTYTQLKILCGGKRFVVVEVLLFLLVAAKHTCSTITTGAVGFGMLEFSVFAVLRV